MDTLVIISDNLQAIQESLSNKDNSSYYIIGWVIGLIEVILLGVYVFFTKRTFEQIKTQTDLQLSAYISIEQDIVTKKELDEVKSLHSLDDEFAINWETSMAKMLPSLQENVLQGKYYSLIVSNHGNTCIKSLTIKSEVKIINFEEIIEQENMRENETKVYERKFTSLINKDDKYSVPLYSVSSFPEYEIITTISYEDVRGKSYEQIIVNYNGTNSYLKQ